MEYYKHLLFLTLLIQVQSTPLFENQIATFIRDFIFSGGSVDQDDDSTDFLIQDTMSNDEDEETTSLTESNTLKDNSKKVLVFFKDDDNDENNKVIKRRGKRDAEPKKPKKTISKQEFERIFTQLRTNLKGKPINMRTILDGLEEIQGGNELGNLFSNSVLAAIREFFLQFVSAIM